MKFEGENDEYLEIIDINGMDITRGLINDITDKAGRTYQLFFSYNWIQDPSAPNGQRIDTIRNGVTFKEVPDEKAQGLISLYKSRLQIENKYIFLNKSIYNRKGNLLYDVVILKANNQFQALKLINTNGLKEGIGHQKIFDFLANLNQNNTIEIYLIDESKVYLKLKNSLDDNTLEAVEKLCPQYEYFQKDLKLIWDK